jgi:hypothetical protein
MLTGENNGKPKENNMGVALGVGSSYFKKEEHKTFQINYKNTSNIKD